MGMRVKAGATIRAEGDSEVFEVLELIGEGRTGEVYLVEDARGVDEQWPLQLRLAVVTDQLGGVYALKIAREEPGESLAARNEHITREQYALERLVHPGIVRSGTGGWHEGRAFFAMEALEGPGLVRFLTDQRRTYREHMKVFLGLSDAVSRCHERGIFHRDIRPSNITVEPGRGPVLFDFESCESRPRKESSSVGVGAAEYACPEYLAYVLDPSASYVNGPRGDMYALGVMLFSFLTGQPLVARGSMELSEYLRALRDVRHVSPAVVNVAAPLACSALAMRLLSKDGLPNALELPRLVREAMEQDGTDLDRLAQRYEADTETLLTSVILPARRPVSKRRRVRWDAGRRLMQRYASHFMAGALVMFAIWLAWAVTSRIQERASVIARLDESGRVLAEKQVVLSHAIEQLKAQIEAGQFRPSAHLLDIAASGLKMPEKPEPDWLKPGADGKCHDPVSGQKAQAAVALRGTCWGVTLKMDPKRPCPEGWFDPPPEVASDPDLGNSCFKPFGGRQPKAVTPGKQ